MFLGPYPVAVHVVMVGSASVFHFMDRLVNVFVNLVQVVPIADLRREHSGRHGNHTATR